MLIPVGYGRGQLDIAEAEARYGVGMEPEYRRRLFAWLRSKGGRIGIGSAWRKTPHPVSAASRAGHSFHQTQTWAGGFRGFAAVDLVVRNGSNVHRAPHWSEVPRQGSGHPDIVRYGLHANISSESWHLQPVEVDGYASWVRAGRPRPRPGLIAPPPPPTPEEDDDVIVALVKAHNSPHVYAQASNGTKTHVPDAETINVYRFLGIEGPKTMPDDAWMRASGVIVGPKPRGVDAWGVKTG